MSLKSICNCDTLLHSVQRSSKYYNRFISGTDENLIETLRIPWNLIELKLLIPSPKEVNTKLHFNLITR